MRDPRFKLDLFFDKYQDQMALTFLIIISAALYALSILLENNL